MKKGKNVTWQYFKDAFNWDQKSFSLPLHEKLTGQHFNHDPASKMRNHLAEDVLDDKMLFLMQVKDSSNLSFDLSAIIRWDLQSSFLLEILNCYKLLKWLKVRSLSRHDIEMNPLGKK